MVVVGACRGAGSASAVAASATAATATGAAVAVVSATAAAAGWETGSGWVSVCGAVESEIESATSSDPWQQLICVKKQHL